MVDVKYANAYTEVLHYLKGISQRDVEKIPKSFIRHLEENFNQNYKCEFDYNKPLNELELLDETMGIIGAICLNYWCETEEEKNKFLKVLKDNEKKHQEELMEKYSTEKIFKKRQTLKTTNETSLIVVEENKFLEKFRKILEKVKKFFKLNN